MMINAINRIVRIVGLAPALGIALAVTCSCQRPPVDSPIAQAPESARQDQALNQAANKASDFNGQAPEPVQPQPKETVQQRVDADHHGHDHRHDHAHDHAQSPDAASGLSNQITPFPGVTVKLDERRRAVVEINARTCLDEGLLEQVACGPNSREHESLVVIKAKPSQIHSALLMAGFRSGAPGRWTYDDEKMGTVPPTGDRVQISVRYPDKAGNMIEQPIRKWIRDIKDGSEFPDEPWVFGGSVIRPNPPSPPPSMENADAPAGRAGGREHYVADMTGSIIGLVTFGDEVIGFSRVFADQDNIQAPEWEVNREAVPPMNTEVTLILRKK